MDLPLVLRLREADTLEQVGLFVLQFIHVQSRGGGRVASQLRLDEVMP